MINICRNFLLNIGPMANGTLHPTFEKVLLDVGDWLNVNSEAVYETIPWKYQTDTPTKQTWYTASVVRYAYLIITDY